ncbi:MAG: site-2 protease family protein [Rhodospirillales bacterium]|nr:site-2 protease family protein [Rhodospirillales bacterium]
MDVINSIINSIWPFLVVITVIVFFHEFGHYWVARRNGVIVEVFSIGFGREIFGWTDRAGTRWKISLLPLGGYVKMFGQSDVGPDADSAKSQWTEEQRAGAFPEKRVWQRFLIVLAGPIANFILAIVLFAGVFMFIGQSQTLPEASVVMVDSAAERGGIMPDDMIVAIDGKPVSRFDELQFAVITSPGVPMIFTIDRGGKLIELEITPDTVMTDDGFGNERETGRLGIQADNVFHENVPVGEALLGGVAETYKWCVRIFDFLGKIFAGTQSSGDLAGPLGIAGMSQDVSEHGIANLVMFMAILSVNLGLINLFPVPMLDGGHLVFYTIEALRGRPLSERAQEYGFFVGMGLVAALFLLVTFNDLARFGVVDFLTDLVS